MYKVTKFFTDLQDGNYTYNVGDIYPREGAVVSETRIAQLASNKNRQGVPLIVLAKEDKKKSLNPATPLAQPEKVEQEVPLSDKPKKNRKTNKN